MELEAQCALRGPTADIALPLQLFKHKEQMGHVSKAQAQGLQCLWINSISLSTGFLLFSSLQEQTCHYTKQSTARF